jgi:hypothetical protein
MQLDHEIIQPDKKAVEAELAKARKRLERFPGAWGWLEQVGRCLRWLGDPEAEAYFRQGAANYKVKEGHIDDLNLLSSGNPTARDVIQPAQHITRKVMPVSS